MSGRKNFETYYQREQRLRREAAMRKAQEEQKRRAEIERIANRIASEQINRIRNTLLNTIDGLNDEIRAITEEQNKKLAELTDSYDKSIEEIRQIIKQNHEEIQAKFDSIQRKEGTHKDIAEFWIRQTEGYFEDIKQYRHELFTPDQLNRLRSQLGQVQQDLKAEAFQSAISSARNVFNQAVDLKERVIQAEIEWSMYHMQFQNALADLKSNLYYHQTLDFIVDTDTGEEKIAADIDYWTNGQLSKIAKETELLDEISQTIDRVSTAELISMINTAKSLSNQIDALCEEAKDAIISSQMRAEMASTMADHLQQAGWEFAGYTYEGNEMNAALHIKFKDVSGNEMVTIISPRKLDDGICNNMELNFFDQYNNDKSLRGIWTSGIIESLRETGINVGDPITVPGYELRESDNEAIRDIEATAHKTVKTEN